jgi:hypothetical protein
MANYRPFTLVAAMIFMVMAVAHAYRLLTHFQVIVGSHVIPQSLSWVAILLTAGLGVMLFREARR